MVRVPHRPVSRWLKAQRFDLLLDFHGNLATRLAGLWLGAERHRSVDLRFSPRPRALLKGVPRPDHAVGRYLMLVGAAGMSQSLPEVKLRVPDEYRDRIESQLQDREWHQGEVLVGIAPAQSLDRTLWSRGQHLDLISRLVNGFGYRIIVLNLNVSRSEEKSLREARGQVWFYRSRDILAQAALLSRCAALVAEDPDVAQLGAAVDTPVLLMRREPGFELPEPPHVQLSATANRPLAVEQVIHTISALVHQGRSPALFH